MTRKAHKITMLEPLDEPESYATCEACHTSFFDEKDARHAFVFCMCPKCGAFMNTTSFQFSFAKSMVAWWRGGRHGKEDWSV